ncbi:MmgE/PrpD family protein (plasmid) [Cupriavidus pinatubonensis]|uniref:MmgE/PrpD family protein n=1 Tax=Cupriavidus pinatubonensis TaxID=248026 RepID=UPI001C731F41|nr:MmgE/PrpD family protein [Cupriavidus pinatubonensis]QYY33935.1 MmgE/PrpD family protein [Cupriavidus pinatubonensis]
MGKTIIERLAEFSVNTDIARLPANVIDECKRDVLDSIGCALAGMEHPKGRIGIDAGRRLGGTGGSATIIGTGDKSTPHGAAFANGELINALDADSVLLPGHVSPYVLPGAFASAEVHQRSGSDLIAAVAVSHEISCRLGAAMSGYRDTKDGKAAHTSVVGYSSTVFGATASAAKLKGLAVDRLASALGIAAATAPVNSQRAWFMHAPTATIKYQMAGALTNAALSAADMGDLGHRGDLQMLDDEEFGYPRFIGTARWSPELLTTGLGEEWRFPAFQMFKPYPHCRVMHAPLDLLIDLVAQHNIRVEEIESITSYGEGWAYVLPCFTNREITELHDAQFCFTHGLAVAAHRITPGRQWQDPAVVFDPSVMALMQKVKLETHPTYFQSISADITSRPSRVEIRARGQAFAAEKHFPKGTPSADPQTYMTTEELVRKFGTFVDGILSDATIDKIVDSVLHLEQVDDFGEIMRLLVRP